MIIEFKHRLNQSEIDSKYLNLKDETGRRYGDQFPPHTTKLGIIDQYGRTFSASKHHEHQIWGNLRTWYEANQVTSGAIISVKYDPAEKSDKGDTVIHLEVLGDSPSSISPIPEDEEIVEESIKTEIPFEFERQLENFVEVNLKLIEKDLRLFEDENGNRGRQYPTDVGTIDLLCLRPNNDFVIIELKRYSGSDRAVGQISRYMGWVKRHLAKDRSVFGVIITHEYDQRLSYAVAANDKLKVLYYKIGLEFVSEEEIRKG